MLYAFLFLTTTCLQCSVVTVEQTRKEDDSAKEQGRVLLPLLHVKRNKMLLWQPPFIQTFHNLSENSVQNYRTCTTIQ